jgi:hypothetical protein
MPFYYLIVGALCVWRITHLLNFEAGPWNLFGALRRLAGDGIVGDLFDCFYCLSLWISGPFAYALGSGWKERLLLWPALSACAILAERLTAPIDHSATNTASYFELPEELHVLRKK